MAQLRGFSNVLEVVVLGDVESLDVVVRSASFCGLGAAIEPTATIIKKFVMSSSQEARSGWNRDGLGLHAPRWAERSLQSVWRSR